jgi:hypothetical protein
LPPGKFRKLAFLVGPEIDAGQKGLHGWRTTVSLPSLVDSQTDSQSITRAAPV